MTVYLSAMDLLRLDHHLTGIFKGGVLRDVVFPSGLGACVGLESVRAGRDYHWDGMKRGGNPRQPLVTIQYTLAGHGLFQDGPAAEDRRPLRVDPGQAFICVIPSEHRYWLPDGIDEWRFVWICFHHPYGVERMSAEMRASSAVCTAPPDDPFAVAFIRTVAGIAQGLLRDSFDFEEAVVAMALAHARNVHHHLHPSDRREAMLSQMRTYLAGHLDRFVSIAELAKAAGLSRSHYSETFRACTGMTPAQYVTQLRLETARSELACDDAPLATIARRCGFADANHLCKVFRRHFSVTPSVFRRQARSG